MSAFFLSAHIFFNNQIYAAPKRHGYACTLLYGAAAVLLYSQPDSQGILRSKMYDLLQIAAAAAAAAGCKHRTQPFWCLPSLSLDAPAFPPFPGARSPGFGHRAFNQTLLLYIRSLKKPSKHGWCALLLSPCCPSAFPPSRDRDALPPAPRWKFGVLGVFLTADCRTADRR